MQINISSRVNRILHLYILRNYVPFHSDQTHHYCVTEFCKSKFCIDFTLDRSFPSPLDVTFTLRNSRSVSFSRCMDQKSVWRLDFFIILIRRNQNLQSQFFTSTDLQGGQKVIRKMEINPFSLIIFFNE